MPSSTPIAEVLAALADTFQRARIRWYLFGAQAVVLWGRPRTSVGVDVTAELPSAGVSDLIRILAEGGFELRIHEDVEDFVERTQVVPAVHGSTRTPVDVVLAGTQLEAHFLERVIPVRVDDVEVPVIAPGDLIVTKMLAGRPRDLEDVAGILAERSHSLDLAEIRSTLREIETALDRSDLIPAFDARIPDGTPD